MADSHRVLKRRLNLFNKKFFNGELPHDITILWSPLDNAHGHAWPVENIIHIDTPLLAHVNYRDIILLHEMAHIKHPRAGHGKVFQSEIDRLYAIGAYRGLL